MQDWDTSPSSRGTATPDGSPSNYVSGVVGGKRRLVGVHSAYYDYGSSLLQDQEKTLNVLDVSHGAADETIGASEVRERGQWRRIGELGFH